MPRSPAPVIDMETLRGPADRRDRAAGRDASDRSGALKPRMTRRMTDWHIEQVYV